MKRLLAIPVVIVLLLLPLAAYAAPGVTDAGAQQQLAKLRQATARYHDVNEAIAGGYQVDPVCVSEPGFGVMGYHAVNPALFADPALDPLQPEALLYVQSGGKLRLVGVEFITPEVGQPHPALFGQAFDGPMPGHSPGMPVHYDLHVWLWQANPAGMFAQFNANLSCD
jgi:hypothetical protein